MFPAWLSKLAKRSQVVRSVYSRYGWKAHILMDWWGARIWTRTREVEVPLGFKLSAGIHPAYAQMRLGTFEIPETKLLASLLPNAGHFVDVGANLGYYTCYALSLGIPVVAFEPQARNLHCLYRNLKANGWADEAEVFPIALGTQPGLVELYGASGPSASLLKNWAGYSPGYRQLVACNTLDNVLAGRFVDEQLIIKIDVEGAESLVLSGANEVLSRACRPAWLLEICLSEYHPGGVNEHFLEVFQKFFERGYSAFAIGSKLTSVSMEQVSRWWDARATDTGTFNYLFVFSGSRMESVALSLAQQ